MTLLHQAARKAVEAPEYKPAGAPMEVWNSPFYDLQTRLEICAGAVAFEREVSANMRRQRDEARAALSALQQQPEPVTLSDGREQFEAWLRARWPGAATPIDEKTSAGFYIYNENNFYWEAWQAARSAPPALQHQEVPREPVGERISDQRILHLWDTHVGDPCAKYPLGDFDKLEFARAVLRAAVLASSTTRQQEVGSVPPAKLVNGQWEGAPLSQFPELQEQVRKGLADGSIQIGCGDASVEWTPEDEKRLDDALAKRAAARAAAPSTPENAGGVQASGEAEPTIREQTLAGLVKRLAWLAPKDHAARIAATECLQRYGYLSPLRADVSGLGAVVSQTPPPLGTDGGTPQ